MWVRLVQGKSGAFVLMCWEFERDRVGTDG